MTRLSWGSIGNRYFEAGVDRGVLYVGDNPGVPWNGLKAVNEAPSGGEPKPYYIDGFKYLNVASAEEYAATLEAFSAPPEFGVCDGTVGLQAGLFATQQPRKQFHLSYRTRVGNDIEGADHGSKIHLVYNALAKPSSRNNQTHGGSVSPLGLSWGITTNPPKATGFKPTAHFVIDSRYTPASIMSLIEGVLYGSNAANARFPTVAELITLFDAFIALRAELVETGVYNIYNVDDIADAAAVMSDAAPSPLPDGSPLLWLDTSPSGYATLKLITGD